MRCMGVHPNRVPKIYECDQCNPRPLDKEAAVQLQLLLREEESSSSDEEPERAQQAAPRKPHNPKRPRKASSNSIKSEESSADLDDRCVTLTMSSAYRPRPPKFYTRLKSVHIWQV